MNKFELEIAKKGYKNIAGIDEVGRGSIAGDLVCAIVIFKPNYKNDDIKDSKLLTTKQRETLYNQIINDCVAYHIEKVSPNFVDLHNPKKATRLCMLNCVNNIKIKPDFLLIDFEKIDIEIPSLSLIKGDQKSISIAAASILAKVYRDRMMVELNNVYPNYEFAKNKGYLTKQHKDAIETFGPIPNVHRFSYKPIKK